LASEQELLLLANAKAAEETGLVSELEIRLEPPIEDDPGRLAVAADKATLLQLYDFADRRRWRLAAVRATWANAIDRWSGRWGAATGDSEIGMLVVSDPDGLVVLAGGDQHWVWAGNLPAHTAASGSSQWIARAAVRLGIEPGSVVTARWEDGIWQRPTGSAEAP
jgi:hypothetical protein